MNKENKNTFNHESLKGFQESETYFIVKLIDYSICSKGEIEEHQFSSEKEMNEWLDEIFLNSDEFIHSVEKKTVYKYSIPDTE